MRRNEYSLEFVVSLVFFQMGWTGSTVHIFEFSTPAWKSFSGKTQKSMRGLRDPGPLSLKNVSFSWNCYGQNVGGMLIHETTCRRSFCLFRRWFKKKKGARLSTFQAMKAETLLLCVFLFYILVRLSFNGQPKMAAASVCWGLRPTLSLAQGKTLFWPCMNSDASVVS